MYGAHVLTGYTPDRTYVSKLEVRTIIVSEWVQLDLQDIIVRQNTARINGRPVGWGGNGHLWECMNKCVTGALW